MRSEPIALRRFSTSIRRSRNPRCSNRYRLIAREMGQGTSAKVADYRNRHSCFVEQHTAVFSIETRLSWRGIVRKENYRAAY